METRVEGRHDALGSDLDVVRVEELEEGEEGGGLHVGELHVAPAAATVLPAFAGQDMGGGAEKVGPLT